jgi:AraC-like DNA-binding protein
LEGITQGADAYLVKPFDERELLGVLQNLLRLQRSIQQRYQQEWERHSAAPQEPAPHQATPVKPGQEEVLPADIEHVFLAEVRRLLELNYTNPDFAVEELAEALHLSRSQALRKIKALTGLTPVVLLRTFRLGKAQALLDRGGYTVAQVAYDCGFSTPNYFSDVYLAEHGHRPSERLKA